MRLNWKRKGARNRINNKINEYLDEAKLPKTARQLPDTTYYLVGFHMDTNGNSVVKIHNEDSGKAFTIQINDPMFRITKKAKQSGLPVKKITNAVLWNIGREVTEYISKHGTNKMK